MKILKTEAQIIARWTAQSPPLVSVIGIVYNQAPYLADAIECFLSQETDFPFEIILHDDASTDATAEIIMRYAAKYPTLIQPILQEVNQFSQGINPTPIAVSRAQGKYIALCEGDDYWTDPKKLQIQVKIMQEHPHCHISFHPALQHYADGTRPDEIVSRHSEYSKIFTPNEVILGSAGFCPTPSIMMDKHIFDTLPKWFGQILAGDYFLQMLAALNSGALYINRVMAVYRKNSIGSCGIKCLTDADFVYRDSLTLLQGLEEMDSHTHHQYSQELAIIKRKASFLTCRTPLLALAQRKVFYQQYKNTFRLREEIMWHLCYSNQMLCRWLYKLEQRIRN